MSVKRKPKKAFIQFAIAGIIALVVGVGAVGLTLYVMTTVSANAEKEKQELAEKAKEAEDLLKRERAKAAAEAAQNAMQPKAKLKEVQALVNIEAWQPITADMVTAVDLDGRPTPGNLTRIQDAIGKIAVAPIMSGEVLSQEKLTSGNGIVVVEPGKRALTIQVDNVGGLDGALMPGLSVDVLSTVSAGGGEQGGRSGGNSNSITRTLLQGVKVLATGAPPTTTPGMKGSASGNSVTLEVTPAQAELLTLANKVGSFHLALRNIKDKAKVKVRGADIDQLVTGMEKKSAPPMPAPPKLPAEAGFVNVNYGPQGLPAPSVPTRPQNDFQIQVYRGKNSENVSFGQNGQP